MPKSPHLMALVLLASTAVGVLTPTAHADPRGDTLAAAAEANGWSPAKLREVLRTDDTARLDRNGRVYYVEATASRARSRLRTGVAPFPLDQTFLLHSRPASTHVILLDFDGATVSGTAWNSTLPPGTYAGYSLDGDRAAFSDLEREQIQSIWQRVAEDYAAFDVDVTTQDPGAAAIDRTSAADQAFGTRALISDDTTAAGAICSNACGGIAYVGVFDAIAPSHSYYQPAWVFGHLLAGNDTKDIAEAVSHEVGHNFGLSHDGRSSPSEGYYQGHGMWAPIMGVGYQRPLTQWSKGEYAAANNTEDDLAIIANGGAPLVGDEAGGTVATAATALPAKGYITSASDTDTFRVGSCTGSVTLSASGAAPSPDLDIALELLDAAGTPVATADPVSTYATRDSAGGLAATVSASVAPGTYYARVDGVGNGTGATGYTDYASIGAYSIAVSGCDGHPDASSPSAPTGLVATSDAFARTVRMTWNPPIDDGGLPVTSYDVLVDGSPATSVTGREATVGDLPRGSTHTVAVRAVNASGTGAAASTSVTIADTPDAPALGRARSGRPGGKVTASVRWRVPDDGGLAITGYEVRIVRARNGKVVRAVTVPAGLTSYVALLREGRYRFEVAALNALGAGARSAPSEAVRAR